MINRVLLILFLFSNTAFAGDPFNAYQWNRQNVLSGSSAVDHRPWYEWWYYKVVDPKSRRSFYWVYGVVNPWDQGSEMAGTRASVAMGSFDEKITLQKNYPLRDFHSSYDETLIQIDSNTATDQMLQGSLSDDQGNSASWNLTLKKVWGFNAMGWAMGIPRLLNIYWYPAQASARMSGTLNFNGTKIDLDNAPAYQDRNWGNSFPKWWAWIVSNQFENSPGTVLAAGGGKPKIAGQFEPYQGMSIGLLHEGVEYHFRPNDGDIVETDISFGKWEVVATKLGRYRIILSAYATPEQFMLLPFASPDGKVFKDYEALNGDVRLQLFKKQAGLNDQWECIADLISHDAGIEFGSY